VTLTSEKIKEYIIFQTNRSITHFYKKYLNIIEDVSKDHDIMLLKVQQETSKEFADNINYMTAEKYHYIRKKILDGGNEISRELEKSLDKLDISL
jgi:folate-dependent tRNA-U54 methylase TrmFO/GidA|tara:strand:- start:803 stop:1087 length:285 start_codon:yes stop_codon:yes gene_type:complete